MAASSALSLWIAGALLLAGLAGAVAAWRTEALRRRHAEKALADAQREADAQRAEAESARRKGGRRDGELQDLRRRLDRAKRRANAAQQEREPLAERAAALENQLAAREREGREAREAAERAERAFGEAERERVRLEASLEQAAARNGPDAAARLEREAARADEERARAERAEAECARLERRARQAEREAGRYRQRERTQRRLYTVVRSQLEAAHDRIRGLEGRPPRGRPAPPPPPELAEPGAEEARPPGSPG